MRSTTALLSALVMVALGAAASPGRGATTGSTTIDQVLARWEDMAPEWKTIAVKFTVTQRSLIRGEGKKLEGQLILKDAEDAVVELKELGKDAPYDTRILWTPTEIHQYVGDGMEVGTHQKPKRRGTGLSDTITLPFLYGRRVAEVREHYDIKLERETDRMYMISFSPRRRAGRDPGFVEPLKGNIFQRMVTKSMFSQFAFSLAYLELDKETLLPRTFVLVDPNGKDIQAFRATETLLNEPVPDEPFLPKAGATGKTAAARPPGRSQD
jgi:hypothetical protein